MVLDKQNQTIAELSKTKEWRMQLSQHSLYLFWLMYFPHYFTFSSPDFHFELTKLLQSCGENPIDWDSIDSYFNHLIVCWFRESWKTSWAKIEFIRNIVFNTRGYMLYVCYDEEASRDALFDIALELQTNNQILSDFWQLYYEDDSWKSSKARKKSKKSSVSNFLTANWVRVQASSIKKTVRWKLFAWQRPDFYCIDDFENNKTKKSAAMTKQVVAYFEELIPWAAANAKIIYLCNKISDTWSVAYLYDKFQDNSNWKIWEKALIENWKITWEERFAFTDKEAFERNNELAKINPKLKVRSIETLKRNANKNWKKIFEQEYLNQPLVDWDRLFNVANIDKYLEFTENTPYEEDWYWKIWEKPIPWHNYVIWADVSEWIWIDSSVIQVIDMTEWEQVAEYCNNYCDPNTLVEELIAASNNYWQCLICPESNSVWQAVIALLKERGYAERMPSQRVFDTVWFKKVMKYWFHTNSKTKPKIIFDLKTAIDEWYLIIKSKPLLRELRSFSNLDTQHHNFSEDMSNHFDRVMAIAIAWYMRWNASIYWNMNKEMIEDWIIVNSSVHILPEWWRKNDTNKFNFDFV